MRPIRLLFAVIAPLSALVGCTQEPNEKSPPPATAPGQLRFLALGDSYTIGESGMPSERWPVQLVGLLRESGFNVGPPAIIATTGWTTAELERGIDAAGPKGPYDLVSLLIGVNNQYRGGDVEVYRKEFTALLRRSIEFAGGEPSRVLVLSIPDWGVTPFAARRDRARVAAEIDRFNAVNREEAGRAGARYVDVTPISREAAARPDLTAPDGLHPSGKMYAEWAKAALPAAREAMTRGGGSQ